MSINVKLIRSSFEKAKPVADKVADKFYDFLWGDYPASKALFEDVNMQTQKKSLMGSLSYIVDHIDNEEKLVPYLKSMGKRHNDYGTQEEHYDLVGASLLKTFAFFFEEEWTEELNTEWTKAYTFIAQTMIEGSREEDYTPNLVDIRSKAKEICDNLLLKVIEEEINENFEKEVRAKVRKVIYRILEEESQDILKKAS